MWCDICTQNLFNGYYKKLDDKKLCLSCYTTVSLNRLSNNNDQFIDLKNKHKKLTKRVNKLEKIIKEMLYYSPGYSDNKPGEGYTETKHHFESIICKK
jgi:hypothetical protein